MQGFLKVEIEYPDPEDPLHQRKKVAFKCAAHVTVEGSVTPLRAPFPFFDTEVHLDGKKYTSARESAHRSTHIHAHAHEGLDTIHIVISVEE